MNKSSILGFLAGATVASAVTYIITKRIVQAKCDQEINEVREYYANPERKTINDIIKEEPVDEEVQEPSNAGSNIEKPDLSKMAARVRYDRVLSNYSNGNSSEIPDEEDQALLQDIEIIDENDFLHTEYERRSMTYYVGDDTLVDDDDGEVIEDVAGTIGRDSLNKFVEGVLHVRNNKKTTDYEISEDPRSYESVVSDLY